MFPPTDAADAWCFNQGQDASCQHVSKLKHHLEHQVPLVESWIVNVVFSTFCPYKQRTLEQSEEESLSSQSVMFYSRNTKEQL